MFKREDGAVLVVESAMIIQFVMLIIILFVMSAILILQKNQLYYNVNYALQMHAKTVDKPQLLSVYANDSNWNTEVSTSQYLSLYQNPRPYRHVFAKNNFVPVTNNVENAVNQYRLGHSLNADINFSQTTQQLVRKMVTAQTTYTFDVFDAVSENTLLSGKMHVKAPLLVTNDFVRQVDFASEIVSGNFVPLQQVKHIPLLFRRLNEGLRHLGGAR